jgi:hypothetical protein
VSLWAFSVFSPRLPPHSHRELSRRRAQMAGRTRTASAFLWRGKEMANLFSNDYKNSRISWELQFGECEYTGAES